MISRNHQLITALGFTLISTSLVACGPSEQEGQPVDAQSARAAITANIPPVSQSVSASLAFLEQSQLLNDSLSRESCYTDVSFNEQGEPTEIEVCDDQPVSIDLDLSGPTQQLVSFLNEHVFIDANIESQTQLEIIYLLRPEHVCQGDPEDQAECTDTLTKVPVRVAVSSPRTGDVDLRLLIASGRHNVVNLSLYRDQLAAELDLGATRSAILAATAALGQDAPELPATAQGRVRASVTRLGDAKFSSQLGIASAIRLADNSYDVQLDAAPDGITMTADGVARAITYGLNWRAMRASAPVTFGGDTIEWDDNGDEITVSRPTVTLRLGGAIAGITAQGTFTGDDSFTLTDAGIGDGPATFSVDGQQVAALNLNADAGRKVDLKLTSADQGPILEVSPQLDLALILSFANAMQAVETLNVPQWAMDEVLRLKIDGANPAKLKLGEQLKMLAGRMIISSQSSQRSFELSGQQCLDGPQDEPVDPCFGDDDVCELGEPSGDDASAHPLDDLEIVACQ